MCACKGERSDGVCTGSGCGDVMERLLGDVGDGGGMAAALPVAATATNGCGISPTAVKARRLYTSAGLAQHGGNDDYGDGGWTRIVC
jgi:hypothetical protein